MSRTFGKWTIGERLGKGGQGKVFLARLTDRPFDAPKALKVIFLDRMNEKQSKMLNDELTVMARLSHPNIIKFEDTIANEMYTKKNGMKLRAFGIVTEVCRGGELFNYLMKGPLPVDIARCYFFQLVLTLQECHRNGVAHRDLKPENLLLEDEIGFNLKVIDFGMAKMAVEGEVTRTYAGTTTYMPPEVFAGRVGYDPFAMDMWSCGILLFIFIFGVPPINKPDRTCWFTARLIDQKFEAFWNGHMKYAANETLRTLMGDLVLRELIQGMLQVDASRRLTINQVHNHPWFHNIPVDTVAIVNEMKRRKVQIDEDKRVEALKKAAARGAIKGSGAMDVFSMATMRALEGVDEDSGAPAPPLPSDYEEEGRFWDVKSDKFTKIIDAHLKASFTDINASVTDKGNYKYKVKVDSTEGESVVFTCQIFFDNVKNISVICVDRREGSLTNFHQVYKVWHENMGDLLISS